MATRCHRGAREGDQQQRAGRSQIFRYGTREHAAVSSETGDVCEVTLVPRDRERSKNAGWSGNLVVPPT
jgi:hypothetical protein